MSLSEHLAALTAPALVALLQRRPDVLVEPVPRTLGELATRLGGSDSLARAVTHSADNRSTHDIRPRGIDGHRLTAWSHLRSAERGFALSGIEMAMFCDGTSGGPDHVDPVIGGDDPRRRPSR